MIKTLYPLLFALFLCPSMSYGSLNVTASFCQNSYTQTIINTAIDQKPFLVCVDGELYLGCQMMDETIYTDQELTNYVNDRFLAVKVDIHSTLGKDWDKEFQISILPAFLMIDTLGQILGRYETTLPRSTQYQVLTQQYNSKILCAAETNTDTNWAPITKLLIPSIKKFYVNGCYNIQLGYFYDYREISKVIEPLRAISKCDVFVLIDKKGNYKTYRILIKGFKTPAQANAFLAILPQLGLTFND